MRVRRLGPNPFGEELSPGAVADCALGLLVDQPLAATLPTPGNLLGADVWLYPRPVVLQRPPRSTSAGHRLEAA